VDPELHQPGAAWVAAAVERLAVPVGQGLEARHLAEPEVSAHPRRDGVDVRPDDGASHYAARLPKSRRMTASRPCSSAAARAIAALFHSHLTMR
jgi:hypothetical protein